MFTAPVAFAVTITPGDAAGFLQGTIKAENHSSHCTEIRFLVQPIRRRLDRAGRDYRVVVQQEQVPPTRF
ncbi:hypothetical protein Rmf_16950 [Roseomonas fluvialis]|uniref:Uncharacterized protein n=1 Tax=Roseomonas fluvialis TaxID=1750527 RepID=A0ABM8HZG5_9PROT|nr:hypothetical protein Rmf_16950 [Roseomonas fluvialis]